VPAGPRGSTRDGRGRWEPQPCLACTDPLWDSGGGCGAGGDAGFPPGGGGEEAGHAREEGTLGRYTGRHTRVHAGRSGRVPWGGPRAEVLLPGARPRGWCDPGQAGVGAGPSSPCAATGLRAARDGAAPGAAPQVPAPCHVPQPQGSFGCSWSHPMQGGVPRGCARGCAGGCAGGWAEGQAREAERRGRRAGWGSGGAPGVVCQGKGSPCLGSRSCRM